MLIKKSMQPKSSKPAKSSVHKAKAKDVSNVYFNYDHAVKLLKAKRCDPQQLLFLERFLKKASHTRLLASFLKD